MNKRTFGAAGLVLTLGLWTACSQPSETAETALVDGEAAPAGAKTPAGSGSSKPSPSAASAAKPAPPPAPVVRRVTVPAGTMLKVRTTNTLSTKTVATGEAFTASLEEPLMEDGTVVAEKGATVYGRIANADAGGRVKGTAVLAVRLTELLAANGERVEISTDTFGVEAKTSKKEDIKKVAIGAGIGAAIGAIAGGGSGAAKGAGVGAGAGTGVVLATRGDAAVIPSETVLTFSLTDSFTVRK